MKVDEIAIEELREAPWNPNRMDNAMTEKLRASISGYGMVENLVVRPYGQHTYEVLSGNQRLKVLQELGIKTAPCVVVTIDDAHARLLAQALNRIQGEDDLGLRARLVQEVLSTLSQEEVMSLLPDSATSLMALSSLGKETVASYLENRQRIQAARLKHFTFQLTDMQRKVVEEALDRFMPQTKRDADGNPNRRGIALYLLCKSYLEREDVR